MRRKKENSKLNHQRKSHEQQQKQFTGVDRLRGGGLGGGRLLRGCPGSCSVAPGNIKATAGEQKKMREKNERRTEEIREKKCEKNRKN